MSLFKLWIGLFIFFGFTKHKPTIDKNCNCLILYNNTWNPILAYYHHDSLVTYYYSVMPKSFKQTFKEIIPDTSAYQWLPKSNTYLIQNNQIGKRINGVFYPSFPNDLKEAGDSFFSYSYDTSSYYVRMGFENRSLMALKYTFYKKKVINGKTCNCFDSEEYYPTKVIPQKDITPQLLFSIPFTYYEKDTIQLRFEIQEYCEFRLDRSYHCYYPGVGVTFYSEPYDAQEKDSISLPIVYLHPNCSNYLKEKFHHEIE